MTSNEDNGDVICMEEFGHPDIRFTNVSNNETFAFSLILVKGFVVGFRGEPNDAELVVSRLERNKPVDEFKYRLRCDKFSVLVPLEAGENEFIFCISQFSVKQTYSYVSSASTSIVTPVYIICRDENEYPDDDTEPNLCAKIVIGCRLIQTLIAESLYQSGYEKKSFSLENIDPNGNCNCVVFKSDLLVDAMGDMTAEDLWEYFGRELMTSEFGSTKRKFVAFVSQRKSKCIKQLAIGGGGLALCDVQFLETWPTTLDGLRACFGYYDVDTNLNLWQKQFVAFSTSLGAVCHELCHTFDLGHTVGGIMGRDFDRVSSIFLAVNQPAVQRTSLTEGNARTGQKDSLIVSKGATRRTLNISYSVNNNPVEEEKPFGPGERVMAHRHSGQHFWSSGCAVLLAHHRWIRGENDASSKSTQNINSGHHTMRYDHIRGVITSTYSIVVVQLRRQCGFVLKSWEFSAKRNKTLFLVPLYEARRASVIVVEDVEGNLLRKDLQNLF